MFQVWNTRTQSELQNLPFCVISAETYNKVGAMVQRYNEAFASSFDVDDVFEKL